MTEIRAYLADSRQFEAIADDLPELINGYYKAKYLKLKLPQQKMGMLAAGALLSCFAGVGKSEEIQCDENGKPSIRDGVHFSISHSDSFTVLALCDNAPVGIDIELIGRATPKIIKKVSDFNTASASDYDLTCEWTRVEAALKQKGTGFYFDPLKLDKIGLFFTTCVYEEHCITCAADTWHSFSLELAEFKVLDNKLAYTSEIIFRKENDQ